jgi:hypothetical protein
MDDVRKRNNWIRILFILPFSFFYTLLGVIYICILFDSGGVVLLVLLYVSFICFYAHVTNVGPFLIMLLLTILCLQGRMLMSLFASWICRSFMIV